MAKKPKDGPASIENPPPLPDIADCRGLELGVGDIIMIEARVVRASKTEVELEVADVLGAARLAKVKIPTLTIHPCLTKLAAKGSPS